MLAVYKELIMIKYLNLVLAGLVIIVFVSCAKKETGAPPRAQRAYVQIEAIKLYSLLEDVFRKEGFKIADRNYSRGYLCTEWFEYEGEKHGLVKWKERRRFSALFDVDRLSGQHLLILELQIQERAPVSSDWREKEVDGADDEQYQRILEKLDNAVRKEGGVLV
jgi:uncharacterized lipoprotein